MFKVRVERCWSGGERHYLRLTLPQGQREFLSYGKWSRRAASEALDVCEYCYNMPRGSVRFIHVN